MRCFISSFLLVLLFPLVLNAQTEGIDTKNFYKLIIEKHNYVMDNEDIPFDDTNIEVSDSERKNSQVYRFVWISDSCYAILLPKYDLALDNNGLKNRIGSLIVQNNFQKNNINQHWIIRKIDKKHYTITGKSNQLNLSIRKDRKIQMVYPDKNDQRQIWTFKRVKAKSLQSKNKVGKKDWENHFIFEKNKEKPRSSFFSFFSLQEMLRDPSYEKPWIQPIASNYLSLNGFWSFHWAPSPKLAQKHFYKNNYNLKKWEKIQVPSNWEIAGYGTPIYSKNKYPFQIAPPFIFSLKGQTTELEPNSVGSYKRSFMIPRNWKKRQVFLHFNGVSSAFYVWINGKKVGYSQNSSTAAEFNITPYIKEGKNTISCQVYRWCDGSYLENHNTFKLSGIYRDVYLFATSSTYIRDFHVTNEKRLDYTQLTVACSIKNAESKTYGTNCELQLRDASNQIIHKTIYSFAKFKKERQIIFKEKIYKDLKQWNAEQPYLYTICLLLKNNYGKVLEATSIKYGFRSIRIEDQKLLFNDEPIFLKGVNRIDMHPLFGHAIPTYYFVKDILLMKHNNINTFLTSHSPNDPKLYALADYYGMYIIDEASIECESYEVLSDKTSWIPAMKDRLVRMIERDKNHPSVIFWSLGNDSGDGDNLIELYKTAKKIDPKRIIHYHGKRNCSDVDVLKNPSLRNLYRQDIMETKRAAFLNEYAFAQGNSLGNLKEYWGAIQHSNRIIGGCLYSWNNQALVPFREPANHFKYGGDFGDTPNGKDNCLSGIITPDGKATPLLAEVKKVYQNITTTATSEQLQNSIIEVHNNYDFVDLSLFDIDWELLKDGEPIQTGTVTCPTILPNNQLEVKLPYLCPTDTLSDYHLSVQYKINRNIAWSNIGTIMATEQFPINENKFFFKDVDLSNLPSMKIKKDLDKIRIDGADFSVLFDTKEGKMTSLIYDGLETIYKKEGPSFNWFRNIKNDPRKYHAVWNKIAGYEFKKNDRNSVCVVSFSIQSTIENEIDASFFFILNYIIYGDGRIDITTLYQVEPVGYQPPRLGLTMQINPAFENISYYGNGPFENYRDRQEAAEMKLYKSTITKMEEAYVRPQSMANRERTRYIQLTNNENNGIKIKGKTYFGFSALHFTDQLLQKLTHSYQLDSARMKQTILNLDVIQRGIGCTNQPILPKYDLEMDKTYIQTFRIERVRN